MTELYLRRQNEVFVPADEISREVMGELPDNTDYKSTLTRPRNIRFHRLFFALLQFAYRHWEPVGSAQKDFERFRKEMLILAGYGYPVFSLLDPGKFVLEAKSISFSNMPEDEFRAVYSAVVNVVLKHVLVNYSDEDLQDALDEMMAFF